MQGNAALLAAAVFAVAVQRVLAAGKLHPDLMGAPGVQSIAAALPLGALSALANTLPLAALGFGWVLPAVIGLLAGIFLSRTEQ